MNGQGVTRESGNRGLITAAAIALSLLLAAALMFSAGTAEAKYKQPNCGKFAKKVKKAKGAKKRIAKFQLKTCKDNRKVYNKVKDSRFIGTRSDGQPIDVTLCANGIVADDVGNGTAGINRGGWKIETAKVKGRFFEAGFAGKIDGGERVGALKFDRTGWQVGIYALDRLYDFGPAEKTDAKKLCRTL